MWAIVGILMVALMIIMIELPHLLRKRAKREIWLFSIFLLVGVALSIANSQNIELPNPLDWITVLYRPFSDALFSLLE